MTPAIWSVLRQYESVLLSLEDMAETDASNTDATARGLLERFGRPLYGFLWLFLQPLLSREELQCSEEVGDLAESYNDANLHEQCSSLSHSQRIAGQSQQGKDLPGCILANESRKHVFGSFS
ncbi:hypothetical protein F7725_022350 [Dissostichus mawsoni]|uniref:Uncharacterized protein n=1 Tax=Dissostichus mawsoni TaxID=36200 RepID=A0A7J5YXP8_DISMA|nr:hypothetical protein F7725_022350 [Dissostichus mawsoni]